MSSGNALALEREIGFRVLNRKIALVSSLPTQFIDVTDQIEAAVRESGIETGVAVAFSAHTTAGVAINEAEPLLLEDMKRLLERFASRDADYQHDDLSVRTVNLEPNERANGHAHCQRLFIGASESIPIVAGRLQMGRWQRVFFVELDGPRPRHLVVQLMGA
ncbi:MAG TPA: secondary thiamine-phosphate synthase enzyme YjbQ [Chloroflexota bacterium]